MRILFISHRVPYPPNKGDKLRAYNILKHLLKNHQVDLLSFMDYPDEIDYARELEKYCSSVSTVLRSFWRSNLQALLYLAKDLPLTLGHFYSNQFKQLVNKKLKQNKYDLIFVFSSSMAQYVAEYKDCPKILDLVDADSEKWLEYAKYAPWWKAMVYRLEGKRLRNYETAVSSQFSVCTVVTNHEKDILKDLIPSDKLEVVKNGFNLDAVQAKVDARSSEPTLLFIGGMFYFAYIDGILFFYKNIFPHIKQQFPNIKFYIVGANPAPSIQRLNKDRHVEVTGHVPEVGPYLQKAWVYVVPLRTAPGIQNKILEAMAYEIPVVATSAAISGAEATHGKNVLVADEPGEFAEAVITLLKNEKYRREIGLNGHNFVEDSFNWSKNLADLDRIIEEI